MRTWNYLFAAVLAASGLLLAPAEGSAQELRTQQLLLDDDATSLANRNTITLTSPADATLTGDYRITFPSTTGLGTGSLMYVGNYAGTNATMNWLGVANDGDVLQLTGGVPVWGLIQPSSISLTQNHIFVGDATNKASEVAPGTTDQVLQIDATGAPTWQSINLLPAGTVENSTLVWDNTNNEWVENTNVTMDETNGNTDINGTLNVDGTSVTLPNITANATNETDVLVHGAGGSVEFRTIDDLLGDATLSQNAIWVGDATNNPAELAAGTTDQVLQIDATGAPTWQSINLLPDGTVENSTLVWDNTNNEWVENTNVTMDETNGNTDINGTLNVDGTSVTLPNITANATNETDVLVHGAGGSVEFRTIDDLLGDATLSQNAIWVGDATNNPAELAAGTTDQVLQIDATGAPTWQSINLLPDGTVENSTLVWDNTNNEWVENTNVTMDETNGNTDINGTLNVDGTSVTLPNITANATNETDVLVHGAGGSVEYRTIDDLLGDATLSQNAIWVGDATNNPAELAAGTTDQVLQIDATGAPTWQSINLLPDGTTNNATLVWDATNNEWVENTNVTMDPTNGNTDINGNVNIDGTTVTIPNIPGNTTNSTTIVVHGPNGEIETRTIDDLIDDASLSQNAIWVGDATNNPAELAAGTTDQVLQIDATGAPTWQSINLLPDGTVENSTLVWDNTNNEWVENTNVTMDETNGNTDINGTLNVDGTSVTLPNITANATNETDVLVHGAGGSVEYRTIDDLLGDATLSQNAIWVGDATNNPAELAAGTNGQVLQIDATGAPTWQTLIAANLRRGRVATTGSFTMTVPSGLATAGDIASAAVMITFEDPAGGPIIPTEVTSRNAGTGDFTVKFSSLPPSGSFINFVVIP